MFSPSNLMKIEAFWAARSFSPKAIGPAMTPESKFSFFAASMTLARVGSGPASCKAFTTAIADGMP